jgi:hypothetical protein
MWSTRIIVAGVLALVVVAAIDSLRSRDHGGNARQTTAATAQASSTAEIARIRRCTRGDVVVGIEIRRPSRLQRTEGPYQAPRRPVATIVVRDVDAPRCLFVDGSFQLTITDRTGRVIGVWLDAAWFVDYYSPGSEETFSLPEVYYCDRPGPFVAVAEVGPYRVRRGYLTRRQITC